jgi:hypothetical protein
MKYRAYLDAHGGQKPLYYDRSTWTALPEEYARRLRKRAGRARPR